MITIPIPENADLVIGDIITISKKDRKNRIIGEERYKVIALNQYAATIEPLLQ